MTPRHLSKSAFQAKHSTLFSVQSSLPFVQAHVKVPGMFSFIFMPTAPCQCAGHTPTCFKKLACPIFLPCFLLSLPWMSPLGVSAHQPLPGGQMFHTLSLPVLFPTSTTPFFTVVCNYQCRCLNLWTRQLAFGLLSIHFPSPGHFGFLGDCHPSSPFGVDAAVCL